MELADFLNARYDEHIARTWERAATPGSAFVRDEYEALKRIVAASDADSPNQWGGCSDECQWRALDYVLRLLAEPYAGHEDYDADWRP